MSNKFLSFISISLILNTQIFAIDTLTLSQAYALALENEPKTKSIQYQAEASKEAIEQAKGRLYPQIQGSVAWGFYGYDAEYLNTPVSEDYTSYSLSATQAVYRPELWCTLDETKSHAKQSEFQYKAQMQELGLEVVKAYFEYLRTIRNVDLTFSQKEFYNSKYLQLDAMLKIGMTNKIDLLESKVRRDSAIAEWMTEQKRLKVAKLKLEYFVNEEVKNVQEINFDTINLSKFITNDLESEDKLSQNPSFLATKAAEESAKFQLESREYEHYPKVDLSLSRKQTDTTDRVAHTYDNQAIVQISIPIYRGGYDQARIREQMKLREAAIHEMEFIKKDNRMKFETLLADRALLIEKIEFLRESQKSAELYVNSMEQGYASGLKSIVDLLEAHAKLDQVKLNLIEAGFDLINNQISTLDLTGELNEENILELEKMIAS